MTRTVPFAQYIFTRLRQLNCHSIHGVPGDFFLRALDNLPPSGVKWIGNANELCAGYAADGYGRVATQLARNQASRAGLASPAMLGAMMTTYGVGELSAINAVAGSYAESQPLVHIVGTPSRKAMQNGDARRSVHHTLADGRMNIYADMAKNVTCAQANLHTMEDVTLAAEAYDEVLENAIIRSKPVYVTLASDMVELPVKTDMLAKPLNLERPSLNSEAKSRLVTRILEKLKSAQRPLIIADGLSYPLQLQNAMNQLVSISGIPAMAFTSGKGVIDEDLPSWNPALPNTTDYSRNADLVLVFGPILSDTNTARWSAIPDVKNTVLFNLDSVDIAGEVYNDISGKALLDDVVSRVREERLSWTGVESSVTQNTSSRPKPDTSSRIVQDDLWPALSDFVQPDDTLLLANGTPLIGGRQIRLRSGCQVVASPIWNAIGSMLPAAQGVALAKRDHSLPGRTILLEGDGSFQVTCQSISDIIRYKLDVTILIANNAGYTYERWLNGKDADYNDVPSWRYTDAARFFGAREADTSYPMYCKIIETGGQLQEVLADKRANDGKGLKILDIVMDPMDVPAASKPGLLRASEALRSI